MAFGTWLKNLITKGKALIKKAAPTIRKGIEIAKKVAEKKAAEAAAKAEAEAAATAEEAPAAEASQEAPAEA